MARIRKTLKYRRARVKKGTRRQGGQLSPISTNSSFHDLDESINDTTSDSMLNDTTSASETVATNLLEQFNTADEPMNLSNNTTTASDASSENSFSDIVSSFGQLANGGKKRMKGGRKTRKHKKRSMRRRR